MAEEPVPAAGAWRCWIGIGSNLERERAVVAAVAALRRAFGPLALSSVYETAAEGFDGPPFLNLVAGVDTSLSVGAVRAELAAIEDANGRVRGAERFAPRTLDLDLLTWGGFVGDIDGYRLPRDEILRCAFVLGPLAEAAPHERHPLLGRSYRALWDQGPDDWPALLRPYPLALPP